jgi:hypothetical protein
MRLLSPQIVNRAACSPAFVALVETMQHDLQRCLEPVLLADVANSIMAHNEPRDGEI